MISAKTCQFPIEPFDIQFFHAIFIESHLGNVAILMSQYTAQRPTWAELNLDNLAFNLHSVKSFIGQGVKVMAVVKANAYGHTAFECSKRLEAEGIDWLGVALVEEAVELREKGIKCPILCLSSFWHGQEDTLFSHDITPAIFEIKKAALLDQKASELGVIKNVHIKIDTGMNRIGVPFHDVAEWAELFAGFRNLHVEGLMTHFAAADELSDELTPLQIRRFAEAVSTFHSKGFRPEILDMANSPGAVAFSDSRATMVRVGGILYGLYDDVLPKGIKRPELEPVLSLHSKISLLKKVPKGESIGYGRTFTTARDSVIASVPIGYHDGYRRMLSNRAQVLVNGGFAPVVGRISMDWMTLDVTDIPNAGVGDEVILIGRQGLNSISSEELGALCDTISYEITCGISGRVPRIYKGERDKS